MVIVQVKTRYFFSLIRYLKLTMSPPTPPLGKDGPHVGLSWATSIDGIYGATGSDEVRLALLDHAHEIGEWFWDTADVYMDL